MNLRFAHWTLKIEFRRKILTFCLSIDSNKSDIVSEIVRTLSTHFKNRFIELEIDIIILT